MRKLLITQEITTKDSISTSLYLKEIGRFLQISPEEEVELIKKIRSGDQEARAKLIFSNLRFVVSIAKKYQNRGLSLLDLISEGNIGLIEAAHKFDETKGFKFITYAVWWIRQAISRAIVDKSKMIRVPSTKVWLNAKIKKVNSNFEQKHHRSPTNDETALAMNSDEYEISSIILSNTESLSIEANPDSANNSLYDFIEDIDSPKPDAGLLQESLKFEIARALNTLPIKEAELLKNYYGLDGSDENSLYTLSLKFDMSEDRIKQLMDLGLKRLRTTPNQNNLVQYLT